MYKIAFCTSIKNRIEHIKETLPYNLNVFKSFSDKVSIQYCVLNYDSTDGLDEWIEDYKKYITYGYVKDRPIFHHSNAKNMSHKLAYAEYLFNLDADNFINEKYLDKLIELVNEGYEIISHRNDLKKVKQCYLQPESLGGSAGRICIKTDKFYEIGGYDEQLIGWGNEDCDLIYRAEISGAKNTTMPASYLKQKPCLITHEDSFRVSFQNEKNKHVSNARNMILANSNYYFLKEFIANKGVEWGK